jgi:CheY-like chemotaxis protein
VRNILLQWDELPEELLEDQGLLGIPADHDSISSAAEGEVVLATVQVAARVTAIPGRLLKKKGHWFVKIEDRDWDRLSMFAQKLRSPPSNRSPSMTLSVRDIRIPSLFPGVPVQSGPGPHANLLLHVLLAMPDTEERYVLERDLRAAGMNVDTIASLSMGAPVSADLLFLYVDDSAKAVLTMNALKLQKPELVMVCTGTLQSADIVALFAAGADDYAEGPIRSAELSAKLVATTRRKRARTQAALRDGEVKSHGRE